MDAGGDLLMLPVDAESAPPEVFSGSLYDHIPLQVDVTMPVDDPPPGSLLSPERAAPRDFIVTEHRCSRFAFIVVVVGRNLCACRCATRLLRQCFEAGHVATGVYNAQTLDADSTVMSAPCSSSQAASLRGCRRAAVITDGN
jgi:hypothetical protein